MAQNFSANLPLVSFDLETSSKANLTAVGAYRYIEDMSTRALMFAWHLAGSPQQPSLWCEGDPIPEEFCYYIRQGYHFSGWNVQSFDRRGYKFLLVDRFGFPPIPDDNWVDSMHRAAAANLPRSLDGAARAVGVKFDEDKKDKARIKRITNANLTEIPATVSDILSGRAPEAAARRTAPGITLLDDMQWLAARCVQDVSMEEGVLYGLPEWPQVEPWRFMPQIDRRINDRGILIDAQLVDGLARAATAEARTLDETMNRLTKGKVTHATKIEALKHFLIENGVELPSNLKKDEDGDEENPETEEETSRKSPWKLRKNDIADILAREDLPEVCRLAVGVRAEASKASARKFITMQAYASADARLRGTMNIGGAQQTMRWASPGVNLYNTVRDVFANPDEIAEANNLNAKTDHDAIKRIQNKALATAIATGRLGAPDLIRELYEAPRRDAQGRMQMAGVMTWISRMTRRTLSAPQGRVLLNGDFAQVEARVTVWLAQQHDMLQAFANREDVYKIAAAGIYCVPVEKLTKQMRQVGKVAILACGFGGGINALITMGYNYGLLMSAEEASPIVKAYREANTAVRAYWYATDDAAANAVRYPGREFPVAPLGLVSYFMDPSGADCLCCRLPSGRWLRYWAPRLTQEYWDDGKPKDRLSLSGLAIKGRAVFRRSLYHTILVENQVQGIATADMLGHALDNMDRNNIPVTLHVYDSNAAEVDEDRVDIMLPIFEQCMLDQPSWTQGLPVGIDVEVSPRFG